MTPSAVMALLVITWPGHDIQTQTVEKAECERALEAVTTAAHIRDERYAMQSDVSAHCIPLNTVADQTVFALLQRPEPSPETKPIAVQRPPSH
jgi:hypothetical protein